MGEPTAVAMDLSLTGIRKSFGRQDVLRGIDLVVPDGQFVTLLGPSGCGKTTLLRIIAGFEVPDHGTVTLGGADLLHLPAQRRPVNTVFQNYALFPHLRVSDNVAFGLRARRVPEADVKQRVAAMLDTVRIAELRGRFAHELSGGQRQRVALARALVNAPEVLLLDEPMSALDASLRHDLQAELRRIQRRFATTFILVTHDQDEAIAVSDRILVMNHGVIEQDGSPEAVYERPVSRFVAEFIGRANLLKCTRTNDHVVKGPAGELTVATPPPWASGHCAIRPEDIEIHAHCPDRNGLSGTITERLFRGDHWEVLVEVPGGQILRVLTEPDQFHTVGERCWLELPSDDLLVLRD